MRIADKELERIMRDYHSCRNNKRRLSKNIPTDEERAELIRKYLEPPKKVKLTFIGEPSSSYYVVEKKDNRNENRKKLSNKIRFVKSKKKNKKNKNIPNDNKSVKIKNVDSEEDRKKYGIFINYALHPEKVKHRKAKKVSRKPENIKRKKTTKNNILVRAKRETAKYSGIEAFGDSGREFRKDDWNDEIARNFRKELGKARKFRSQMGWNDIDRGALK